MNVENNTIQNMSLNICIRKDEGVPVIMIKKRLFRCPYTHPMIAEE